MCEASSGCNQTLECLEQNEVKYCGVFLLSDIYWQDSGAPVLQGDDPNRIGGNLLIGIANNICTINFHMQIVRL